MWKGEDMAGCWWEKSFPFLALLNNVPKISIALFLAKYLSYLG
jgi:hypothetical protein